MHVALGLSSGAHPSFEKALGKRRGTIHVVRKVCGYGGLLTFVSGTARLAPLGEASLVTLHSEKRCWFKAVSSAGFLQHV